MLVGEPGLWALPPKFCILVDGGGVLPLADVSADIMVRPGEGALTVHLDGGTRAALCAPSSLAETVKALALAFLRLSAQPSEKPRRMRALVMAAGEEAIFAEAGLTAVHASDQLRRRKIAHRIDIIRRSGARAHLALACLSAASKPTKLHALADISERYGDGNLRTTPWRALLLTGVAATDEVNLCEDTKHSISSPIPLTRVSTSSPVSARRPA